MNSFLLLSVMTMYYEMNSFSCCFRCYIRV